MELATGDAIDADTAASWGLINRVVADDQLDDAVRDLMARSIRGSAMAKGIGKRAYYAQVDMEQPKAYAYAMEAMAAGIVTPDSQEGISAFFEKRRPEFNLRDSSQVFNYRRSLCERVFRRATTLFAVLGNVNGREIPLISSDSTTPLWSSLSISWPR